MRREFALMLLGGGDKSNHSLMPYETMVKDGMAALFESQNNHQSIFSDYNEVLGKAVNPDRKKSLL